jgi:hypothetical protein
VKTGLISSFSDGNALAVPLDMNLSPTDLLTLADIRLTDRPPGPDEPARPPQPDLAPLPWRMTVMIVDDERPVVGMLERVLRLENYDLLTAENGPDALRVARAHGKPIDLLITDYAMSGMHGRELAATMRQETGRLAVLYQTGYSDLLFADRLELEDRAAFLEKPYSSRGIREAARLILFGTLNPA